MTFKDYKAIPAVNWSSLKHLATSPLHYHHALTHDRPDTAAMALGRAVHCAVLEPDEFPQRYALWKGVRRGGEWFKFAEALEAADREVLTEDEYAKCLAIRDAVRAHPVAGDLFTGGQAEVTVTWTDPKTDLKCKARLDYLTDRALIDIKTTRDLDPRRFQRTFHDLGYWCQLAMYMDGVKLGTWPEVDDCLIVAVESEAPHDVAVLRPTEDALYAGREEVARLLSLLKSCLEADEWPGRYPKTTDLDLPDWFYAQAEAEAEAYL